MTLAGDLWYAGHQIHMHGRPQREHKEGETTKDSVSDAFAGVFGGQARCRSWLFHPQGQKKNYTGDQPEPVGCIALHFANACLFSLK